MTPPARGALAEFAIVVIGVFVALAAESWWSTREERAYEREIRADMVSEFDANLRILREDLAVNDTAVARMTWWGALDDRSIDSIPADSFTAIAPRWAGFDPEMGSVRALVESNGLASISDRDLRTHLARWAGLLQENRRKNAQAVEFQTRVLLPTVARNGADREWTLPERREVRRLMADLALLASFVVESQEKLSQAAGQIRDHLDENP